MYRKIIKEHELGAEWRKGKVTGLLKPGVYSFGRRFGRKADIFDTRQVVLRIPGQEVILSDRISIKINITGIYQVSDPVALVRQINKDALQEHITQLIQLGVRGVLASKALDDVIEKRDELNAEFAQKMKDEFNKIGLSLNEAKIKDVILPSELRSAYAESLTAQLKAKAQLEQARGQSAALRNLANTADLIEKHPQLIQLMSIQKDNANLNIHFDALQPKK